MSISLRSEIADRISSKRAQHIAGASPATAFIAGFLGIGTLLHGSAAPAADTAQKAAALAATADSSADGVLLADAGDSGSSVSEITVSARRRSENAQSVPIPIAALGGDSLEQAGQFRLESLNQSLPSTNIQYANPRQASIAVRGLGNNPANDALESSVGVYLDDVYLGRASMANQDLFDVEQVALLRGPQGTLFGKHTTAGVVNITTRQPTFDPQGSIEASYGNYNAYQVRGVWSQPLVQNEL